MINKKIFFIRKYIFIIMIVFSACYVIPASYIQSRQHRIEETKSLKRNVDIPVKDHTGNWMCLVPFVIGFTLFFVLLYFIFLKIANLKKKYLADGHVTTFASLRPLGGGLKLTGRSINFIHAPIIEFVVENKKYQFNDTNYFFMRRYKVGQHVKVYYDPDNPNQSPELKSIFQWLSCIGGLLIACVFMIPILQYFGIKW